MLPNRINHLAEVKRVLRELRRGGFTVVKRHTPYTKCKWYGFKVEYAKVHVDLAVVFDNLNPDKQVEVCLAVGNKIFWNSIGRVGEFKWTQTSDDFELLLAGALYDKVPTTELYNDKDSAAFVVTIGSDGSTRVERAKGY